MEHEHVLGGLAKRRAELTGEANALRAQLARLAGDLERIDVVIRLFDPGYDVGGIKPRRPRPVDGAVRGDMARWVLTALRKASAPLTVGTLARRLMAERQMDPADPGRARVLAKRLATALRWQEQAGTVQAVRRSAGAPCCGGSRTRAGRSVIAWPLMRLLNVLPCIFDV